MLAFRVVFLLYLFISVAGSAAAAAGCNRRSEDPNTFAAYAFLYAIYVCACLSLPLLLHLLFFFFFLLCLVFVRFVELPALNQLCFGGSCRLEICNLQSSSTFSCATLKCNRHINRVSVSGREVRGQQQ